ncbi:mCG145467, partial [Mus musculus]
SHFEGCVNKPRCELPAPATRPACCCDSQSGCILILLELYLLHLCFKCYPEKIVLLLPHPPP